MCIARMSLLRWTIDASLLIQWISLIFGTFAFLWGSPAGPLASVLNIENGVQLIELIFYHWYRWVTIGSGGMFDIAWVRYLDWMVTTPLMLISTGLFFEWKKQPPLVKSDAFSLSGWINDHSTQIISMVLSNGIMLLVGFLQEIHKLDIITSTLIGFLALGVSFWILYSFKEQPDPIKPNSKKAEWLYPFMYIVWSIYGFAAMLPPVWKNICYNILDIFSKNFYGSYVSYLVFTQPA